MTYFPSQSRLHFCPTCGYETYHQFFFEHTGTCEKCGAQNHKITDTDRLNVLMRTMLGKNNQGGNALIMLELNMIFYLKMQSADDPEVWNFVGEGRTPAEAIDNFIRRYYDSLHNCDHDYQTFGPNQTIQGTITVCMKCGWIKK